MDGKGGGVEVFDVVDGVVGREGGVGRGERGMLGGGGGRGRG